MLDIIKSGRYDRWETGLRDKRLRATIAARIVRLANGLAGDVTPVGDGISELRIHAGPGYRIYFKHSGTTIIILLCGGDKSSQGRDIQLAKQIAKQWDYRHD